MLKPRESITGLSPYRSPIGSRSGLNLDLNESMAGCSPRVLARLRSVTASDISLYPQRDAGERLVADFLGLSPEQVLLTNGMDEALSVFFSCYLYSNNSAPGELLFADPTFVLYPLLGAALGAKVVRLPPRENLALPVDDFLAHISARTRVIVIANPNNPTGLVASRANLLRIAEAAPDAAVLIDEAYIDFYGGRGAEGAQRGQSSADLTLIPSLEGHPNLFVARTFSKAYGLAGLRLGVVTGAAEQIGYLRRLCLPFNVNSIVLACLQEALADQEFVATNIANVQQGRVRLTQLFEELGLHYWPSHTNFVLVRVGDTTKAFVAAMQGRGIMVRDASASPGCAGCVRITVGTPQQMDGVVVAIREAIAEIQQ